MTVQLLPGDELLGYCSGYFGRDSYETKRVEAVGADWVVAREEDGSVVLASDAAIHKGLARYCVRFGAKYDRENGGVIEAKIS